MILLQKSHIYFRFQLFLIHKDNNEVVMTVLEDLVRSDHGDKSVTVPDISDDAKEYISNSKVIIFIMTKYDFAHGFRNSYCTRRMPSPRSTKVSG